MYAYLSKKLEMPQGANVRAVAWSGEDNFLACGCENGMLKVLKIETTPPAEGKEQTGCTNRGMLAAPSNIAMNQTLEGHSSNIQVIAWNNIHQKLTTSDAKGLIIVWMLYKGTWYEEMVNNRNRSTVRGLGWSHDGNKICIVYEDGGVIVGSADGNRLWGKDLKGTTLAGVSWSPDAKTVLFTLDTGEVHIYDTDGNFMSKMTLERWPKNTEMKDPIVTVRWKNSKNPTESQAGPGLAVVWKAGKITLLKNSNDENPMVLDSGLVATCGDWSPNGLYLAVGGSPINPLSNKEPDQVRIYCQTGKFLQVVKSPGSPLTSLSWDYLSLRLAIGAGPHVYFANLRPLYQFAFFGSNVFAYYFTRPDSTHHIAFWDTQKVTSQEIPGRVLDVKGDEEHFAVLSTNDSRVYNVSIMNAVGAPVDSLSTSTMEPFTVSLTESILVILASNMVLLWRYQSATNQSLLSNDAHSRRRERSFHIDETPNFIPEPEHSDHNKPEPASRRDNIMMSQHTTDPAICCDAKPHLLVIGRESGRLQLYSLPHGALLNVLDIAMELGIRSQRILLNSDGLQMAMLDAGGHLSVCSLSTSSMKSSTIRKYDRKDIWNLIWARDNPSLMCIMEKTRMYVMRNGEVEEPVITSGYLAYFKDLEVTMILMDEIMLSPESPLAEYVTKIETRALRDIRSLIEKETPLEDVAQYVEENSHPSLWRILAQAALGELNLSVAEAAFVRCKDYAGVQLSKRISNIPNDLVRKAEVATFFEDFDKAERLYLEADRKDLAIEMWKLVGDWKKVELLTKQRPSDRAYREMCIALGDALSEEQEWGKALALYEKADDPARLVLCYLMMEDYERLDKLASTLPENSPLLPQIGTAFEAVGLATEAVKTYLACGMAEKAVETAVVLSQWNLAMELAQKHSLHNVAPVLLRYTGHLLESGEIMQAVELLRKSGKPYAAGKLLAMLGLRELGREKCSLIMVKKVFVMSAMMFTYKTKRFFRSETVTSSSGSGGLLNGMDDEANADLSFQNHIPEEFRPTTEEFRWMRETPWRGATALHFLILIMRFIHQGQYGNATKASLHLRNFGDILGEERVNSLVALAAANSKSFHVCSRAFINLELVDEEYGDIASELFSEHPPKDTRGQRVDCSRCGTSLSEYATQCINCESKFPICMATGQPILDLAGIWTCDACNQPAVWKEVVHRKFCPLCHTELQKNQSPANPSF